MRTALLFLLLAACEDPYGDAAKVDTIEAWESYLATEPSGSDKLKAESRLEELLVEKTLASTKPEDFDAVLKRFPNTRQAEKLKTGRATAAYAVAEAENTPEAWQKFLDENPTAEATMKKKATNRVQVAGYQDKLVMGEVKVEQVNLAEDPKGPKDGWGFTVEVQNTGDKTLDFLNLEVQMLSADDVKLATASYPLVGQVGPGNLPLPEEYTQPLKPGDKRVWNYTTGDVPKDWTQKARVVPVALRFSGNLAEGK
jgi:hypothetical protein